MSRAGASSVVDVVPLADRSGVIASTENGAIAIVSAAGDLRHSVRQESEGLHPVRIIAVTPETVCLWGWEEAVALDLATGKARWWSELGHSHDETYGECASRENLGCLHGGLILELATGKTVEHADFWKMVDSAGPVVAHDRGFAYATSREVLLWQPDAPLTQLACFERPILALACRGSEIGVVLADGTIRVGDRSLEGPVPNPVAPRLAITANGLAFTAIDADRTGSTIAIHQEGRWSLVRSAPTTAVLGLDGDALGQGNQVVRVSTGEEHALPSGSHITAACALDSTIFLGCADGSIVTI